MTRSVLCVLVALGVWISNCSSLVAQDAATMDVRISSLEQQLREIDAQLSKLEFIQENVSRIRDEDIPQLDRDLQKLSSETTQALRPIDQTTGSAATARRPYDPPLTYENSAGSQAGDLAGLDARATRIEQIAARIEQHLKLLDDVAEDLDLLRNRDLVAIQRELRGLREVSKRVQDGGSGSGGGADPTKGVVVINNWTGATHSVVVNGKSYRVGPGRVTVTVDYGRVVTQVAGEAEPRQWDNSYWKKVGGEHQLALDLKY